MDVMEETFSVKTYHCRSDGGIKVWSVMQMLQEVAAVHAERLGFGLERLNEMDSYWVLSNILIDFAESAKWNDRITIRTWPSGHTRSIATREFIGTKQDKQELFRAGSEWMVLKKSTNRPRNLSRLDLPLPAKGARAICGNLKRLGPQRSYTHTEQLRVPYSSIDLNGHVNNTEYVRWTVDALKRAFDITVTIRCIQVTYFCEVFEGDRLEVLLAREGTGRFHVLGRKSEDNAEVYAARISC